MVRFWFTVFFVESNNPQWFVAYQRSNMYHESLNKMSRFCINKGVV